MPTVDDGAWRHLRLLARELGHSEKLTEAITQWDRMVRYFRQIEQSRFYEDEPTDLDRENHRALLHLLIGLGQNWLLETRYFTDHQWSGYGFTRADSAAYIADLEDTFFLFYAPDFEPARTAELQRAIFGANP